MRATAFVCCRSSSVLTECFAASGYVSDLVGTESEVVAQRSVQRASERFLLAFSVVP